MARVCDTADRLWLAPNDCGSELRSTTQAICDAWPLEFERTKLPCACSPMLPATRQAQVLRGLAQSDPAAAVSVLIDDAAALIDLDQLPK